MSNSNDTELRRLFTRRARRLDEAERAVLPIIKAVRTEGDRALLRYARRWDGFKGTAPDLAVPASRTEAALEEASPSFRKAVREAARNIRDFCRLQMPKEWQRTLRPGVRVGQIVRPLESVGCYIPAGRYPLPST
ncbi:MAG: histidinol dehydrogenase, partial [Acidobacteria bacterium]|nr:histidinol dehydrogenase [Acidobacteriota bacterium]